MIRDMIESQRQKRLTKTYDKLINKINNDMNIHTQENKKLKRDQTILNDLSDSKVSELNTQEVSKNSELKDIKKMIITRGTLWRKGTTKLSDLAGKQSKNKIEKRIKRVISKCTNYLRTEDALHPELAPINNL